MPSKDKKDMTHYPPLLTPQSIFLARKRIQYIIRRTPLQLENSLSKRKQKNIHLKLENLQITGAFKLRGAANKILTLTAEEQKRGLVTASSGNHGRALSYVAGQLGICAVICLSDGVPQIKRDAIAQLGGEVIMAGHTQDEAIEYAHELSKKQGLVMASSFDDLQVIAGQGTIGLEILEDLPSVNTIITPLSGGSLLSGIGLVAKAANPNIKIVGVSMERAPVMIRSLKAGKVIDLPEEPTIADGLAGGIGNPNLFSFQLVQQLVNETVMVTEEEISRAMAYMLHEHHLVIEGAGAVALAAVMHDKVSSLGANNVVIISGGNVNIPRLMEIYSRFYAQRGGLVQIQIFKEDEIREHVPLSLSALDAVAEGFIKLSRGEATIPPIMQIAIPENDGEVDVKSAYIKGLDHFAIKVAGGFYKNPNLGLPVSVGMMMLINAFTGFPEAFLLDNGYLTNLRTALAGAIAAQQLAKPVIHTVGIFGSGTQSRFQLRALKLVRSFEKVIVFGIDKTETQKYANEMALEFSCPVVTASNPADAVFSSDLVITATPSQIPYLRAEWLHPGLHITAMGADSVEKQELFTDVPTRSQIIACDYRKQSLRLGELHHAIDAGIIHESQVIELGEILSGQYPGRTSNDQITLCDLTGVGVQDTQIALFAAQKLRQANAGFHIEN